jgi:hypothetical protein
MRSFFRLTFLLLSMSVFFVNAQAQQIRPGKSYSIRCAAMYNDIDLFLSSRFNSAETVVQMDRMESQSVWQFVAASGGYKMMSVRHNGYIFQDGQGRLMITKDAGQAKVFMTERAYSGNFYFKAADGTVLHHQNRAVVLADGKRVKEQKIQEAEWIVNEINGQ